jgi:hypothetical protein
MGINFPITPVDATSTFFGAVLKALAAIDAMSCVSRTPCAPVQALAQPELHIIARTVFDGNMDSHLSTLDARMAFVVNVPAAVAGRSLLTTARSGFPEALIPALTPAARKPAAAVTPPLTGIILIGLGPVFFACKVCSFLKF